MIFGFLSGYLLKPPQFPLQFYTSSNLTQCDIYDISTSSTGVASTSFKLLKLYMEGTKLHCPKCQFENRDTKQAFGRNRRLTCHPICDLPDFNTTNHDFRILIKNVR